ncbi:MAG: ABC transporter ATP-binding protein [Lachnospiraceae bacterium]|nr:ABC transporter ATP-binding protein [Lachnospiraceae bacterium]
MKKLFQYRNFFVFMLFLSLLSAVVTLLSPVLINIWSKTGVRISTQKLVNLFLLLVVSLVLEVLLTIFREKFAKQYNIANFNKYLHKYCHLDYDTIQEEGPTNLLGRIQMAVNNLYSFMTESYIQIWSSLLILAAILGITVFQNLFIAGIMLLLVFVNYFGCSDYQQLEKQVQPAVERIYGSMADINVFAQASSKALRSINSIAQTMIMALTVFQYLEADGSPLMMVLMVVLFPIYTNNLSIITNANLSRQNLNVSKEFIRQMDEKEETDGTREILQISSVKIDIDTLQIKGKELAHGIRGKFYPGDIVWIKGESGKGKSTLVKLLLKFRQSDGIWLNGIPLSEITNASLRLRMNYLSQNVPIVKGSLRENLFFNKEWDAQTEEKLKQEPILQGILQKKTMDSFIEENGANLSGGEKQRIALARALYDKVDVMILDEVTSNIDKESAEIILHRVIESSREKIIFVISHDTMPEIYANFPDT